MTTTTDASPPADDSGIATEHPKNSQHRSSRLNQALAWVGVVAGGLFIVAAIFFSGFFLSWGLGGPSDGHKDAAPMACCDEMKAGQPMKPGAMMAPGGQMKPGEMMPGGMMGPGQHPPTSTPPSTPRP